MTMLLHAVKWLSVKKKILEKFVKWPIVPQPGHSFFVYISLKKISKFFFFQIRHFCYQLHTEPSKKVSFSKKIVVGSQEDNIAL